MKSNNNFIHENHEKQVIDLINRMASTNLVETSINDAFIELIKFDSYFGLLLVNANMRIDEYAYPMNEEKNNSFKMYNESACVCYENNQISMVINPKYWSWLHLTNYNHFPPYKKDGYNENEFEQLFNDYLTISLKRRMGLLKHEALHLILEHLIRSNTAPDKKRMEIAKEIEVNQWINNDWLYPNDLIPEKFQLPFGLTCEEYYKLLKGKPIPQTQKSKFFSLFLNGQSEFDNSNIVKDNHNNHYIPQCLQDFAKEQIESIIIQTTETIKRSSKSYGNIPKHFINIYDKIIMKSNIPWERILEIFMSNIVEIRKNQNFRRPSRRNEDIYPSKRKKIIYTFTIATDESASVKKPDFMSFCLQIDKIISIYKCKIQWIHFDCEVNSIEEYKGKWNRLCSGGTNFQKTIDYCVKNNIFDLICFTDGEAPIPDAKGMNIIWVFADGINANTVLSTGKKPTDFPGRKVYIKLTAEQRNMLR